MSIGDVKQIQDRLRDELLLFAECRALDVVNGAETPALAGLQVQRYGAALARADLVISEQFSVPQTFLLVEVSRQVERIDPAYKRTQQYQWASRPAGLSFTRD